MKFCIAEYLPLKQGLKPIFFNSSNRFPTIAEYLPLKQGLKPISLFFITTSKIPIAEYLPLKQGLKQIHS